MNHNQMKEMAVNKAIVLNIPLQITPRGDKAADSTKEKYSHRLNPDEWINVRFSPHSIDQYERIYKAIEELREAGICFDTGGCSGRYDWELDWSLHGNEE